MVQGMQSTVSGHAIAIDLGAVIVAVEGDIPHLLVCDGGDGPAAIPTTPFDPTRHRTLDEGARSCVAQAGAVIGLLEALETFGDRFRDPAELSGAARALCIAHLALGRTNGAAAAPGFAWLPLYELLPWEDWRDGPPAILPGIRDALGAWIEAAPDPDVAAVRRERARVAFGRTDAEWNPAETVERWFLLNECELVAEARRDGWERARQAARVLGVEPAGAPPQGGLGVAMALDHRRLVATALGRWRRRLRHRPAVFSAMPQAFTLLHLQQVVEALAGLRLHKQNFRRLALEGGLLEPTSRTETRTGGRPAALYRWRRDILRPWRAGGRPAGIGLPTAKRP